MEDKMTFDEAVKIFETYYIRAVCDDTRLDGIVEEALVCLETHSPSKASLAEFLGWEVRVEYKIKRNSLAYKVTNDTLYYLNVYRKSWVKSSMDMDDNSIRELKNATKIKPEKRYYAKIKGWELISSTYCHFGLDDLSELEVVDRIDGYRLTKKEWAELGITSENADFEEVEE